MHGCSAGVYAGGSRCREDTLGAGLGGSSMKEGPSEKGLKVWTGVWHVKKGRGWGIGKASYKQREEHLARWAWVWGQWEAANGTWGHRESVAGMSGIPGLRTWLAPASERSKCRLHMWVLAIFCMHPSLPAHLFSTPLWPPYSASPRLSGLLVGGPFPLPAPHSRQGSLCGYSFCLIPFPVALALLGSGDKASCLCPSGLGR